MTDGNNAARVFPFGGYCQSHQDQSLQESNNEIQFTGWNV